MALAVALLIGSLALATTAVLPPDELWMRYASRSRGTLQPGTLQKGFLSRQ
jgi:hypothetical protein